eukprot:scaffold221518_cov24-Attheya_sp.AAC.1
MYIAAGCPELCYPKTTSGKTGVSPHTLGLSSLGEGDGSSHCSSATSPRLDDVAWLRQHSRLLYYHSQSALTGI